MYNAAYNWNSLGVWVGEKVSNGGCNKINCPPHQSHDLYPGPSGVWEKHFPLLLFYSASGKLPFLYQPKWIKIYQSQPSDVTFWTHWGELLFPERSVKIIDGSEKCNCWLCRVCVLLKGAVITLVFSSGSQIASWFPSFSVEVMHTRVNNIAEGQLPESRIEAMVRTLDPHLFTKPDLWQYK